MDKCNRKDGFMVAIKNRPRALTRIGSGDSVFLMVLRYGKDEVTAAAKTAAAKDLTKADRSKTSLNYIISDKPRRSCQGMEGF